MLHARAAEAEAAAAAARSSAPSDSATPTPASATATTAAAAASTSTSGESADQRAPLPAHARLQFAKPGEDVRASLHTSEPERRGRRGQRAFGEADGQRGAGEQHPGRGHRRGRRSHFSHEDMSEDGPASTIDDKALKQLMEMGFSLARASRALLATNQNIEEAIVRLTSTAAGPASEVGHPISLSSKVVAPTDKQTAMEAASRDARERPAQQAPTSSSGTKGRGPPVLTAAQLSLISMGFRRAQAVAALDACAGDVQAAALRLISLAESGSGDGDGDGDGDQHESVSANLATLHTSRQTVPSFSVDKRDTKNASTAAPAAPIDRNQSSAALRAGPQARQTKSCDLQGTSKPPPGTGECGETDSLRASAPMPSLPPGLTFPLLPPGLSVPLHAHAPSLSSAHTEPAVPTRHAPVGMRFRRPPPSAALASGAVTSLPVPIATQMSSAATQPVTVANPSTASAAGPVVVNNRRQRTTGPAKAQAGTNETFPSRTAVPTPTHASMPRAVATHNQERPALEQASAPPSLKSKGNPDADAAMDGGRPAKPAVTSGPVVVSKRTARNTRSSEGAPTSHGDLASDQLLDDDTAVSAQHRERRQRQGDVGVYVAPHRRQAGRPEHESA
jgi:NACalpha-BTF3-like transcription factor